MNKYSLRFLLILPLLQVMSLEAQAAQPAMLLIPEALDVVTVDNQKFTKALFSDLNTTLKLQPGQHKIVVEYNVLLDIGFEDHEIIKSEPFQIAFNSAAGEQYYIKVPAFKEADLDKARAYARKPVIQLINSATHQAVVAALTYREFDGTLSSQFTHPSPGSEAKPAAVAATFTTTSPKTEQQTTGHMPLKMLEYWWQQASAQQRQQFLESR